MSSTRHRARQTVNKPQTGAVVCAEVLLHLHPTCPYLLHPEPCSLLVRGGPSRRAAHRPLQPRSPFITACSPDYRYGEASARSFICVPGSRHTCTDSFSKYLLSTESSRGCPRVRTSLFPFPFTARLLPLWPPDAQDGGRRHLSGNRPAWEGGERAGQMTGSLGPGRGAAQCHGLVLLFPAGA